MATADALADGGHARRGDAACTINLRLLLSASLAHLAAVPLRGGC
jgi:hypothetical protein